jgi:TolA-binding protein
MRNGRMKRLAWAAILLSNAFVGVTGGCGNKEATAKKAEPKTTLEAGYAALEAQKYNEAISKAEAFLTMTPQGAGSAEAFYLKGRSFEAKAAAARDANEAKENLQAARNAYIQALDQRPMQPLEAYIRTSLANVAYFQEDYPAAIGQWSAAIDNLDRDDLKAWALYRIGLCQQRIGKFEDADRTFATVQQKYPGVPAQRAKEHQGARGFFLQVATFETQPQADKAIAELSKEGLTARKAVDPAGHHVVRIPTATYGQAVYLKNRFASKYPDAVVLP